MQYRWVPNASSSTQSMRYFRLKKARKWNICQTPSATRKNIVNQAKFCTREFVDTWQQQLWGECVCNKRSWRHTVGFLKPLLTLLQIAHLIHDLFHNTLQFPHFGFQRRQGFLICDGTTQPGQKEESKETLDRTCSLLHLRQCQYPGQQSDFSFCHPLHIL